MAAVDHLQALLRLGRIPHLFHDSRERQVAAGFAPIFADHVQRQLVEQGPCVHVRGVLGLNAVLVEHNVGIAVQRVLDAPVVADGLGDDALDVLLVPAL